MASAMAWMRFELQLVLMAMQFLTRIPMPSLPDHRPGMLQHSVRYFPWVGALVGAFGAALACAAATRWSAPVAAAIGIGGTAWLTAAFHEDGLADTADALLGAASRDKALAIMKDSRIGTYGAAALIVSFLMRVLLLAELLPLGWEIAAAALMASHAAGRMVAVGLMASLPYARDGVEPPETSAPVKAGGLARDVQPWDAAMAACSGLLVLALAAGTTKVPVAVLISVTLALGVLLLGMHRWLRDRIAGYTGDTLGAAEQIGEVVVLLCFAGRWA